MGIKSRPLRIVLVSLIASLAVLYIIIVQYSFTQIEGTWAAFVRENEVTRISAKPGFKLVVPGEQVINLPMTQLAAEIPPARYTIGDSQVIAGFIAVWHLSDPKLYLDTLVSMENTDSAIIDGIKKAVNDTLLPGNDLVFADLNSLLTDIPAVLNNSGLTGYSGIVVDKVILTDYQPASGDEDLEAIDHAAVKKDFSEKLKTLQAVKRQWNRDQK